MFFLAFRLRIRGSRFRGLLIHDQVGECRGRGEIELCVCDPGPGGSWDLVSKVISILVGIIHVTTIVTLFITLVTTYHDPSSKPQVLRQAARISHDANQ